MTGLIVPILVLAVGTYGFRIAGPLLREKVTLSPRAERLLSTAAMVLILAVAATSAVFEAQTFAGWARPAGVAVGGLLAWRKAPFVLVVVAAAAVAAGLRLVGVR